MSNIAEHIKDTSDDVLSQFNNPFTSDSCGRIEFVIEKNSSITNGKNYFVANLHFNSGGGSSFGIHSIKGSSLIDIVHKTQLFLNNLDLNNG